MGSRLSKTTNSNTNTAKATSTYPKITTREAKLSDIDDMAAIAIASFVHDPPWDYRFPYAKEFPEEHYKYTRMRYGEYLANAECGACTIIVAETASKEDPEVQKVVAMSIWQMPGAHIRSVTANQISMMPPADNFERPDASPERIDAFRTALKMSRKEFFNDRYGQAQLNLMTLVTLPDYWRRGIGTKLTEWGVRKAKEDNLTITLFASPMGERLYRKLGFKQVGVTRVQVEGEDAFLHIPAMVRDREVRK